MQLHMSTCNARFRQLVKMVQGKNQYSGGEWCAFFVMKNVIRQTADLPSWCWAEQESSWVACEPAQCPSSHPTAPSARCSDQTVSWLHQYLPWTSGLATSTGSLLQTKLLNQNNS